MALAPIPNKSIDKSFGVEERKSDHFVHLSSELLLLERRPATPDEGSAKRRRVAVKDLPEGVAGAVVTTVWRIPQGLGSFEDKLRFGVICDAHPVWGWSGPLMRGKLSWVASKQSVFPVNSGERCRVA
jgi:hypothetical protein